LATEPQIARHAAAGLPQATEAVAFEGRMIDAPVAERARGVLRIAVGIVARETRRAVKAG